MTALRVVVEERRPFFTPKSLAEYLSISERTARQMIADRRIESVRVEGVRRIPAEAVDAYVERHRLERAR
jgi:excisionase family DNA binding protein